MNTNLLDHIVRKHVKGLLENNLDESYEAVKQMVNYVIDNPKSVPVPVPVPSPELAPNPHGYNSQSKWPFPIKEKDSREAMEKAAYTRTQKHWEHIDPDLREEFEAGWETACIYNAMKAIEMQAYIDGLRRELMRIKGITQESLDLQKGI